MNFKLALSVSCIILLSLLCNCRHDKKNINYIDSQARDIFCAYNFGSFWVYQNQNGYDNMSVGAIDPGYDVTNINQNLSIEIGSTIQNQEVDLYLVRLNNSPETHVLINYYYPYGVIYELAFANNQIDSNGIAPYSYAENLVNYKVNQYTFPSALKISSTAADTTRYIIYAPNVGIIEKRLLTTEPPYKLTFYQIKE